MDYTHLGRTGTSVSRIVLGTMNFGDRTSEEDSIAILDRALELGVNFIDTANGYGGSGGRGATEEIIGRWFAARPGVRDDVVLATKVHSPMVDPTADGDVVNARGASAWQVRREAIGSLKRLQTDRIDLYQFHHIDRHIPWQELWQSMEVLVAKGEVVYTGSSNFAAWNIAQANEIAKHRHFLGLVSEQSLYNLTQRSIELEVIPAAQNYGLGILPWSPLAGGLLSGGSTDAAARSGSERITSQRERRRDQIAGYEAFAKERGWTPSALGLAWLLHQPGVTGPIIGPRTVAQLESAVSALDIHLSAEDLAALDELFPGPGGQAPEAYAW
ncbi:aryl-alcohol dehydrogenase-like predicted oxidoreductase [Microbacterium trichothecenolyticum]|uniref:aldo/keto reductase n=1 Tax=Microbacterium trichothecenolyticum TaxID=69370 RepID=UPI002859510F|nr:aldo/keto reductase [Microbacterium trichothecenolyticum]MDR7113776.1 aryl-alcohol dehydrogenase-like predicted oxidoreductase [Microbacterium trichothecenolyticum]